MNEFYHAFTVSFNWWFVVAPAMLIFMVVYGTTNLKLNKRSLRIMRRDKKDFLLNIVVIGLDIILHVLILAESAVGILQSLLNHLGEYDDPLWALILFVIGLSFSGVIVYAIFFVAAKLGERLKRRILIEIRREM